MMEEQPEITVVDNDAQLTAVMDMFAPDAPPQSLHDAIDRFMNLSFEEKRKLAAALFGD